MGFPTAAETGVTHERTALPFKCTVHAPHCAIPQPYLVPVRPRFSRITQSSGVDPSTSTWYSRRFTFSLITAHLLGHDWVPIQYSMGGRRF